MILMIVNYRLQSIKNFGKFKSLENYSLGVAYALDNNNLKIRFGEKKMSETKKLYLLKQLNFIRMNAEGLTFEDMHILAEGILENLERMGD